MAICAWTQELLTLKGKDWWHVNGQTICRNPRKEKEGAIMGLIEIHEVEATCDRCGAQSRRKIESNTLPSVKPPQEWRYILVVSGNYASDTVLPVETKTLLCLDCLDIIKGALQPLKQRGRPRKALYQLGEEIT